MDCSSQHSFQKALDDFKSGLSRKNVEDFKDMTYLLLQATIGDLQASLHLNRRLQGFHRLDSFLQSMKQFGTVIQSLGESDQTMHFVWGPLKYLLQAASAESEPLNELLNAYESLGESLPAFMQYAELFSNKPHMVRVLVLIFEEILKFQDTLLRFFQQNQWHLLFRGSWTTYHSRFSNIIDTIAQQRSLIESNATPDQVEIAEKGVHSVQKDTDDTFREEDLRRSQTVTSWLRATNIQLYQDEFCKVRAEFSGTGRWLLENNSFKEWFSPQFPAIPPLLWLNGIPGAGKTILASMIVREAQQLIPEPTVLYFYFMNDNIEQNNFMALARTFLIQFLKQDRSLLSMLYQECSYSGESMLTTPSLAERLLSLAFDNCRAAYIVLDGLDECSRQERKLITQWFRKLVEDLPSSDSDRLRCLFVSQDDGVARKDFSGITSIKIGAEDTRGDIEQYCQIEANKLKESLGMSADEASKIAGMVANASEGLFLLTKLIWMNLKMHTSIGRLREELELEMFPKEINDAYDRIMTRIKEQTSPTAMEDTLALLGWLVCAKRDLKVHEIQVMKSIDLAERTVAFESRRFGKSLKDICASLVEIRADNTVHFVHSTAKLFLTDREFVSPAAVELKLAGLCMDYLNLPAFTENPTESRALNGDYGFMDYAVIYWLPHLIAGLSLSIDGATDLINDLINDLTESLEIFVQTHWASPKYVTALGKRQGDKIQVFKDAVFFDKLEIIVSSTTKHLKHFGNMRKGEIALDLVERVKEARACLEKLLPHANADAIEQRYGVDLFKCSRVSCQAFTSGFASAGDRDRHTGKHERPYRCPIESCPSSVWGFALEPEQEQHMRQMHLQPIDRHQALEFPTEQDVVQSIQRNFPELREEETIPDGQDSSYETGAQQNAHEDGASRSVVETESELEREPESELEPDPEPEPAYVRPQKKPRQTEFVCQHCSKKFGKRYNLTSHLLTHGGERPYTCGHCTKSFIRDSDRKRHEKGHTEPKKHVCEGCHKAFERRETLRQHYKSKKGKACLCTVSARNETGSERRPGSCSGANTTGAILG